VLRWREDIAYLASRLPQVRADGLGSVSRAAWDSAASQLEAVVPRLTDGQLLVGMARMVAMLHDGHATGRPDRRIRRRPGISAARIGYHHRVHRWRRERHESRRGHARHRDRPDPAPGPGLASTISTPPTTSDTRSCACSSSQTNAAMPCGLDSSSGSSGTAASCRAKYVSWCSYRPGARGASANPACRSRPACR